MTTTILKVTAVLIFCGLPSIGMTHNVTVGDFGGTSTNGAFVSGTWTPTADSNLDNADFQAALNTGDVTIMTNGAGNIEFQNDSGPFTFPTPPRTLLLQAEGNVSVARLSTSDVTDGPLNLVINASSAVSVATTGDGVNINGGDFNSSGTDFSCSSSCIATNGGDITLNHTGSVSITDGGADTGGGKFTSSGTDFSCNGGCIYTTNSSVAADITLNHTGNVSITDGGVNTSGGRIVIKAVGDIAISGNGVASDGGAITLYYSANFALATGAIISSGDPSTSGGRIILHATDSMTIEGDVTSASGSGGTVAVDEGVIVNGTTTAGAGNVRLYLRSKPSILQILGLNTVPVPALSALGVGLLTGLMLLLGCHFRRQTLA